MPGSRPVVRATAVAKPKAEAPVAKAAPQPQPESVAEAKPVAPKPAPAPKPQPAPTKQIAKTESSPARSATPAAVDEMAGWNKTGLIEFLPDQGEVADGRMDAVRFLAGSLNSTLSASPSSRVQILAYGGTRGDKGSDARRLSLRRALSVRQILIDSGVSRDQIDVRAMGGADDGGPADRVDVYVRS
jgi:outer membrane protein OmpA-like peptidoglycan-associated protein